MCKDNTISFYLLEHSTIYLRILQFSRRIFRRMRNKTAKGKLASAMKEMRTLDKEAERLADILSLANDQLNRLKVSTLISILYWNLNDQGDSFIQVEELTMQGFVAQASIDSLPNACASNAEALCTNPTKSKMSQDSVHEVNKTNLDLSVIPSSSSKRGNNNSLIVSNINNS